MSPRYAIKKLSVTDSTISIADLPDYVNVYYPEVLPLDILNHFGKSIRPKSEFGDNVKFSKDDTIIDPDELDEELLFTSRGYRSYKNINLNTLDDEKLKLYNGRGWAYDLLNDKDMLLLSHKIDEIHQGLYAGKLRLGDGTFLVDANDKALVISGTRQMPVINLVLLADTKSYIDNIDIVKDVIYESERFRYSKEEFTSFLEFAISLFREENLQLFKGENFQYKKGERDTGQRAEVSSGFEDDIYSTRFKDRTGDYTETQNRVPAKRDVDIKRGKYSKDDTIHSDSFKDWFGDWQNHPGSTSKVVDKDGKPLVVYHGTGSDFNVFDKNRIGQHFGESRGDTLQIRDR